MSSQDKNLSDINKQDLIDISNKKFGIVVSEWNSDITEALFQGALTSLLESGAIEKNIFRQNVPGAFELPFGCQFFARKYKIDAIIALGCVIKGETSHDEYINNAVAQGLINVGLKYKKPTIFGVLTTNDMQQALDRAGGKHGNKGTEAAITAIKMLALK